MSVLPSSRPSVVVVGGGFAGFLAARTLERLLPADAADLTIVSPTDHLCYSPLLPSSPPSPAWHGCRTPDSWPGTRRVQ
jgi:NADH dehydrogenase FAD-containing subunit